MDSVLAFLNGPVGVAAALVAVVVVPKLVPALGPFVSAILAKMKPAAPSPATPSASPAAPADPSAPVIPTTGHPLIDLALKVFASVAAQKFPALSAADALERYLVEQTHYGYFSLDSTAAKPADVQPAQPAPAVK